MNNQRDPLDDQRDMINDIQECLLAEIPKIWTFPDAHDRLSAEYGASCAVHSMNLTPIMLDIPSFNVGYGIYESYEVNVPLESLVLSALDWNGADNMRDMLIPELKRLVALLEERTRQPADEREPSVNSHSTLAVPSS